MEGAPKLMNLKDSQQEANMLKQITREHRLDNNFERNTTKEDYDSALFVLETMRDTEGAGIKDKIKSVIELLKLRIQANASARREVAVEDTIKDLESK